MVHGHRRPVTGFKMARVSVQNAPLEPIGIKTHHACSYPHPRVLALNQLVELPGGTREENVCFEGEEVEKMRKCHEADSSQTEALSSVRRVHQE